MNNKIRKTSIVAVTVASFAIFAGSVSAQQGPGNGPGGPGGRGGEGRPPVERPFGGNGPFNQEGSTNQPPFLQGDRPNRPGVDLLQSIVEASGLTPEEIRQQIQDGATIEDILAEAGTSIDEVIDQAVADGLLTEEQAQNLKDRIAEGDFPNLPGPMGGPGSDIQPVRNMLRHGIQATAELTGLDVTEIRDQLRDGASIKEILEANGSSVDALVDVLVADASERLNALVEEGKITAEQAAERLADLETRLTERLNEGRPFDGIAPDPTEESTDEAADA